MSRWISVGEAMPELEYTYPEYLPRDQRAISEPVLVRGKTQEVDYDYFTDDNDEDHEIQIITEYWIYSIATLRRTWNLKTNDGWILHWDCQNDHFWYGRNEVTHWMEIPKDN